MEHSVQADKQQRRKQPAPQAADPEIQAVQPQSGLGSLVACARVDPGRLSPSDVLRLQRVVGNRAVTALIQAKLTVGPVGDRYEQEADRVAEQVLTMPSVSPGRREAGGEVQRQEEEEELQAKPLAATITPFVQRQGEEEELQAKPLVQRQEEEEELQAKLLVQRQEEEEELQAKPLAATITPLVQRQEDEEELQMKSDTPRVGLEGGPVAPDVEAAIQRARGGGQPLDGATQAQMGESMGHDFSGVRVHADSEADELNWQLQAKAFTTGPDIFFKRGEYNPGSSGGRELIAHELSHVVQQAQGRVKPTMQLKDGVPVNDDQGLEHEADVLIVHELPHVVQQNDQKTQRAEAALEGPVQQEHLGGGETIQRRVAIAIDNKVSENDAVILSNLEWALDKAGGPVLDFGPSADFSTMAEGEPLMIVEHGAVDKIGNYDSAAIVRILTHPTKGIPDNILSIIFLSCEAGLEAPKLPKTSLVEKVSEGLEKADKKDIEVIGSRGLAITHSAVGEHVVRPDKKFEYLKIQWKVVKDHGLDDEEIPLSEADTERYFSVREAVTVYTLKTAKEILIAKGGIGATEVDGMTVEEKAKALAPLLSEFYKDLISKAGATLFDQYAGKRLKEGARESVV